MPSLTLCFLGKTRVTLDDSEIEVKPRKALALLVYLAVTAESQARDALAAMLWPDSDRRQARHSLRCRLSELNRTLNRSWIEADRESICLQEGFTLDVAGFQACLAGGSADLETLIRAVALYRGDFLAGFSLPDCPEFDEWKFFCTESLRHTLSGALQRLVEILNERGQYETAVPYARRWLALDPLHETAHRQLMFLYARAGRQAAALRQYRLCCETLSDELGIPPSPETTALYGDIRTRSVAGSGKQPRPNLPAQTSRFINRDAELASIRRLLLHEPACRLLTMHGPAGAGKTRLALAAATELCDVFPDGVCFVPLPAGCQGVSLAPAIAEALDFPHAGTDHARAQLLDCLRHKEFLLVLDNLEGYPESSLLCTMLREAKGLTLLVTSRERLNLREEWVFPVENLATPPPDVQAPEALLAYSGVTFFVERARQTTVGFDPSPAELIAIGRIGRLVDGLPLALELAASWTRTLACREIAVEIERSLDFLTTPLHNVPERQRSLRAVYDDTWRCLPAAERRALARLSRFPGVFSRTDTRETAGTPLEVLASLVDKSLLFTPAPGQYRLPGLLRRFAAEKVAANDVQA